MRIDCEYGGQTIGTLEYYSKEFGGDLEDHKDLLKARDQDSLNSKTGNGHIEQ